MLQGTLLDVLKTTDMKLLNCFTKDKRGAINFNGHQIDDIYNWLQFKVNKAEIYVGMGFVVVVV